MTYAIYLGHQAKKEMAKIDRSLARRLRDRLRELAVNPLDPRLARQMETDPNRRYSRVGLKKGRPSYVAIFRVADRGIKLIEVRYVGTHEDADYRRIC